MLLVTSWTNRWNAAQLARLFSCFLLCPAALPVLLRDELQLAPWRSRIPISWSSWRLSGLGAVTAEEWSIWNITLIWFRIDHMIQTTWFNMIQYDSNIQGICVYIYMYVYGIRILCTLYNNIIFNMVNSNLYVHACNMHIYILYHSVYTHVYTQYMHIM